MRLLTPATFYMINDLSVSKCLTSGLQAQDQDHWVPIPMPWLQHDLAITKPLQ